MNYVMSFTVPAARCIVKKLAIAASLLTTVFAADPGHAATYYITNVSLDNGFDISINGSSPQLAGAIGLTLQGNPNTVWVWCVDIYHEIVLGSYLANPLPYVTNPVTTDSSGAQSGTGNTLASPIPGEIATLAGIGTGIANANGDPNALSAIQGAIWQIEYGVPVTSGNAGDDALIANYVSLAQANPKAGGDPNGLYPVGPGGVGFGTTQGFSLGVPEPATWATMLIGLGMIGAVARRRHKVRVSYS